MTKQILLSISCQEKLKKGEQRTQLLSQYSCHWIISLPAVWKLKTFFEVEQLTWWYKSSCTVLGFLKLV